jgi:uncharacterized protein YndB with AHSA1/START domain
MGSDETAELVGAASVERVGTDGLRLVRRLAGARPAVWAACVELQLMRRWLHGPPGWELVACEFDLRSGGPWRIAWRDADGAELGMGGVLLDVEPGVRMRRTESWGEQFPSVERDMVLADDDGGTLVTLTLTFPSAESRDAAAAAGFLQGFEANLARLDALVAG